ncbi:Regulator of rDNA transcription protein 15 [Holothuria leucospilota]|uniref:Regulator of rDNA transcription protein 15 n=1 Tax=Holothuria leucospilota TaxID=206669 RepID=A0A9Q1CTN8_HOLLE|nr:Regulator of rDNA transcription protein 15 [Holothuria leucospilota]
MIGRADIEGSKSDVAMNAWPPQASYPCGNFSDTPCVELGQPKGSIGPAFAVCIRTENRDQESFCPFALREVSGLAELALGHLRYHLTDVPPQSNSPPDGVSGTGHATDAEAPAVSRAPTTAQPSQSTGRTPRKSELATPEERIPGRLAQPRRAPGPASWETRPDRPSPQSQSLSRSYGSGLPTSLTYIVLFGQRLFTLETCCGYRYDNQARVRQDVLHSPGFSRADRSSPDAAAGATFSGATGPYLRKNHSPGRHMLLK